MPERGRDRSVAAGTECILDVVLSARRSTKATDCVPRRTAHAVVFGALLAMGGCGRLAYTEHDAGRRDAGGADAASFDAASDAAFDAGPDATMPAVCGDGVVNAPENCDDGNATAGDGCGASCTREPGAYCATPGVRCTVCGDGVIEGLETCEDGNTTPYDGCDALCLLEPDCTAGACVTVCGDGALGAGEGCDDGNLASGDGCSSACDLEAGYVCERVASADASAVELPVVFRDFRGMSQRGLPVHPDFNARSGSGITFGMVGTTLDAEGRPTFAAAFTAGALDADSFHDWYRASSRNLTIVGAVTLDRTGDSYTSTSVRNAFFPLDGLGWQSPTAIGESYGDGHNFSFTTELHVWFEYTGAEVLTFNGDDDLWVFVDGQLCLDVGGLHSVVSGTMSFANPSAESNTTQRAIVTACRDRLTIGQTYELVVFHAERAPSNSDFELSLVGFQRRAFACRPVCGDGVVSIDEACDLGATGNDGSYGGCNADCTRAPYCGDGLVQSPEETCDEGAANGDGTSGCSATCTLAG